MLKEEEEEATLVCPVITHLMMCTYNLTASLHGTSLLHLSTGPLACCVNLLFLVLAVNLDPMQFSLTHTRLFTVSEEQLFLF